MLFWGLKARVMGGRKGKQGKKSIVLYTPTTLEHVLSPLPYDDSFLAVVFVIFSSIIIVIMNTIGNNQNSRQG